MYMLEGSSRWNINRGRDSVNAGDTSRTSMYDIRLMSNINDESRNIIGHELVPEFSPPGKPTDERIAVEYLLAQSGQGYLQTPLQGNEIGATLPGVPEEENQQEEELDSTICEALHIHPHDSSQTADTETAMGVQHSIPPTEQNRTKQSSPPTMQSPEETADLQTKECRHDSRGVPGWEAVDNLAKYVDLSLTITALSTAETADIVRLYSQLHTMDQSPTKYTLKSKKRHLPGPWRASRKRSEPVAGQQAAERLFMTHGQAAQKPDTTRVSECVYIRLVKLYEVARNRPRDMKGKLLPLPQSIVAHCGHIRQQQRCCWQTAGLYKTTPTWFW